MTSWEETAVNEISNAEQAIKDIDSEIASKEDLYELACALGLSTGRIEQRIEELYSARSDWERFLKHE